ncbi:hypothetical protein LRD18_09755 [Halorhodospira halochloris]|uniref:hypothetical protein n=1 Tax=Halorhodospira halochloris TaxID=1052 RepID=UPI001EE8DBD6|nr:hypothetical protein [Halorhodospira halochloris]MCG5531149.1 hypothetical protein [Halorhodospira halochloris]
MTAFDSTKASLNDLLREIREGALDPALLRSDDFNRFIEDRRRRLVALIEHAMGKQVNLAGEKEEYELTEAESFAD